MMGNAVWSGVRLRQVLLRMFPWLGDIDAEHLRRFHVHFKSKDGWVGLFLHPLLVVVITLTHLLCPCQLRIIDAAVACAGPNL